jgi:Phage integrase, N-terminal SAM-like domain
MAQLSPLRRRMIEDMTVRNMSPATQRSYVSAVSKFSRYFGKSPEWLSLEDVRAFQVHLVSTGISWPGLNQIVCALRFGGGHPAATASATRRADASRHAIGGRRPRLGDPLKHVAGAHGKGVGATHQTRKASTSINPCRTRRVATL